MSDAIILTPPGSEHRLADLNILIRVITQINRSLDPEDVFRSSLEGIRRYVGGEFGCFLLLQNHAAALQLKNAEGLSAPFLAQLQGITIPPEVFAEVAASENQAAILSAIGQRVAQVLDAQGIRSCVILPLTARGHAVGILLVGIGAGKVLAPLSVDLLMSIGEQVGMAIENARLHSALAESEEWHRTFIEDSPDGFWETDADGHILYANDSACKTLGYSRNELLQMRRNDFLLPDRAAEEARLVQLLQTGAATHRDGKIRARNGEIRSISYATRWVRDAQGGVIRQQSIFRDVTAQQELVETLQHRNQEHAALNMIAGILNHPLEITQSLDQVCEQIASITGMETAVLYLLDEAAQRLNLLAQRGLSPHLLEQARQLGLDDPAVSTILIEGQAIALNEVSDFPVPASFAGPREEGYHAGIGVPILRRGVPVGAIYVGSLTATCYEQSDVGLLLNVGKQIGVALENADLYKQMQRRVLELDGLAQLSAACATQRDPQTICRLAVEWTKKLLSANLCVLRLIENDQLRLGAGMADPGVTLSEELKIDRLLRQVIEQRTNLMLTAVDTPPPLAESGWQELVRLGVRAFLVVPVQSQERVTGILTVGCNQPHAWSANEIDLLQTIANQVGGVLENARLDAQTQQRVQELDGLAHISGALFTKLDPQYIAEMAVDLTQRLYSVDVVDLSMFLEGKLYRKAARINYAGPTLTEPIVLGDLVSSILELRIPLVVRHLSEEPNAPEQARHLMSSRGLQALLVVPLVSHDRAIGTLAAVHSKPRQWPQHEIDLLQTIANQVGHAIDNARLYQETLNEQRKVQAIFDSGLSGLYATDAAGRIVMFNRAAERITGWTREQAQGKKWEDLLGDAGTTTPAEPLVNEALIKKQTHFLHSGSRIRTEDGRSIPVAQAVAPLLDETENVIGAVGAFWDLSREQRAEIEYENFLAMIAHQLRSPLTSVLSALELLERRNLSDARRAEVWNIIRTEGHQLKRLADQFLDHQAIARAARPLKMEPLSVAALVRQQIRKSQSDASQHHFQLRVPRPEPWVVADADRVEHILRNLLDNAVSYSPADSPITIRLQVQDKDWVEVAVQDYGEGIPVAAQAHLFERFYRVPQTSERRVYGHGLGLSLAQEMVNAMGGRMWVESELGKGATFYFTLRRADERERYHPRRRR